MSSVIIETDGEHLLPYRPILEKDTIPLPWETDFDLAVEQKLVEEAVIGSDDNVELRYDIAGYIDQDSLISPGKVILDAFTVDWQTAS